MTRARVRCWYCNRRLFRWRKQWHNLQFGTTCWKCRCGFLTVRRTSELVP